MSRFFSLFRSRCLDFHGSPHTAISSLIIVFVLFRAAYLAGAAFVKEWTPSGSVPTVVVRDNYLGLIPFNLPLTDCKLVRCLELTLFYIIRNPLSCWYEPWWLVSITRKLL